MFKNFALKVLVVAALIAIPYEYVRAQPTGEPPSPGTEHLLGPAVTGTITIEDAGSNTTTFSFSGKCKGNDVNAGPITFPIPFASVTVELLEDFRPGPITDLGLFPGCYRTNTGDVIIEQVTKFSTVNGTTKVADVVMLAVVPK